jgi:large subunit ribosomal protein L28
MSRICQLSGKKVITGNHVSHSNRKTKRKFYPNLVEKVIFVPEEGVYYRMKISTSMLRTISKKGAYACIKDAREKGIIW